jgi:ribosomal protein S18 acetylase RimI-like enzyme
MRVRPAVAGDADAIAAVHVRGWQAGYAGIMPADTLAALDVDERAGRWRGRLAGGPGEFATSVAVDDPGAVVGFSTIGPYRNGQRPDDLDPRFGELIAIYVDPDRWGTGAGAALMTAALADLAGRGWTEIRLWVLADNARARRFYERFGLAPDGERAMFRVDRPDGAPSVQLPELRYVLRATAAATSP